MAALLLRPNLVSRDKHSAKGFRAAASANRKKQYHPVSFLAWSLSLYSHAHIMWAHVIHHRSVPSHTNKLKTRALLSIALYQSGYNIQCVIFSQIESPWRLPCNCFAHFFCQASAAFVAMGLGANQAHPKQDKRESARPALCPRTMNILQGEVK